MAIILTATPLKDLSNNLKSLVAQLPRYVSVDFLDAHRTTVRKKEYKTNHYPLNDTLKTGSLITEKHLEDAMHSAALANLKGSIEHVLLTGKFTSSVNGDIDWYKEFNLERKKVKQSNVEEYFKALGYEDLYFYSESFKPVTDTAWDEYSYQEPKTVVFPANLDVIRVSFSPANRFSTINKIAKPAYLFKYPNEDNAYTEYMYESNFIVILDKPELIVEVI